MNAQLLGKDSNPPLVFLHGFLGSNSDWSPIAEHFVADYFCILPDLFSHIDLLNQSQALSFDFLTRQLQAIFAYFGFSQVPLLGYSLGGRVALNFAFTHPEKVSALMLESTSPGIAEAADRAARAKLDDLRAQQILDGGIAAFVDEWYEMGLWASLKKHPAKLANIKASRKLQDAELMANIISELSPGRMANFWARLPELEMPVQLIAGELDKKYAAITPKMADQIPGAQMNIIPNAGHNTHLEQPDAFVEVVRGFLFQA